MQNSNLNHVGIIGVGYRVLYDIMSTWTYSYFPVPNSQNRLTSNAVEKIPAVPLIVAIDIV